MTAIFQDAHLADSRLRQIAHLATLQQDHAQEFNLLGESLVRRAIFTMVLDCRAAGVPMDVIRRATAGASAVSPRATTSSSTGVPATAPPSPAI